MLALSGAIGSLTSTHLCPTPTRLDDPIADISGRGRLLPLSISRPAGVIRPSSQPPNSAGWRWLLAMMACCRGLCRPRPSSTLTNPVCPAIATSAHPKVVVSRGTAHNRRWPCSRPRRKAGPKCLQQVEKHHLPLQHEPAPDIRNLRACTSQRRNTLAPAAGREPALAAPARIGSSTAKPAGLRQPG